VEFLIAGVGLALAVWMILGARRRHRSPPPNQKETDA
jgi:hypothetical protein